MLVEEQNYVKRLGSLTEVSIHLLTYYMEQSPS